MTLCKALRSDGVAFGMIVVALGLLWSGPAAAQFVDTTPPQLTGLAVTPSAVNVETAAQSIIVDISATDDLSGVAFPPADFGFLIVQLRSPSGTQNVSVGANGTFTLLPGGSTTNGTWRTVLTVPRFSEAGTWTIQIGLRDTVGNRATFSTAVLASRGFPSTLSVTSLSDLVAPVLTSLVLSPASIDVSTATQAFVVDFTTLDTQSGVDFQCRPICYYMLQLTSPSGRQSVLVANYNLTATSAPGVSRSWRASVTVPRYAEPGLWRLSFLLLRDVAGNTRSYVEANIAALGFTTTASVVSSPFDVAPPLLSFLNITPRLINSSLGARALQIDLGLSDDLSGPSFVAGFEPATFNNARIRVRSPSGLQIQEVTPYTAAFVLQPGGSPLGGTWRTFLSMPQFSEAGFWDVLDVQLVDAARNLVTLNTAQLQALGVNTRFEVVRPSLATDAIVSPPAIGTFTTVTDSTFGARASLSIPGGAISGPTSVAIDVLTSPLAVPAPTGFRSSASSLFVSLELDPAPAFPLGAPGLTAVLPLVAPRPAGTPISLFRINEVTGLFEPSPSVSGGQVVGSVNADGLSATFTGIARLSIVAGFERAEPVACRVDADTDIDRDDIALITAARNQPASGPTDPRDPDRNNTINVLDARICTLRCDRASCAVN